jgi:hypothetical protein
MLQTVNSLTNLIRAIASIAVAAIFGTAGYFGYQALHSRDAELAAKDRELETSRRRIEELDRDVAAKQQEIVRLNAVVKLLKVDHRVAQIIVLDQGPTQDKNAVSTRIRFAEVDAAGSPIGEPQEFTIKGDVAYVDAWVVKFKDEFVEKADALRGTSICIFRRLFGEHQAPEDGFSLDPVGSRPAAYSHGHEMTELEREIWSTFWDIANDPNQADKLGVRAAHGEAPSIKLVKGRKYKIDLRASGGLTITPEDNPPAARGDAL